MSKRLQVLLADHEMSDIDRLARRERLTVGEWVRRALRDARASLVSYKMSLERERVSHTR
ncbi:MAG: hypothetical protein ACR2NN_00410 [Bryobacteraceae bacterium]